MYLKVKNTKLAGSLLRSFVLAVWVAALSLLSSSSFVGCEDWAMKVVQDRANKATASSPADCPDASA